MGTVCRDEHVPEASANIMRCMTHVGSTVCEGILQQSMVYRATFWGVCVLLYLLYS
jgi:hypothetical protein